MAKITLSRPHEGHKAGDTIEIKPHELAFYKGMGLISEKKESPKKPVKEKPVFVNKETEPQEEITIRPSK